MQEGADNELTLEKLDEAEQLMSNPGLFGPPPRAHRELADLFASFAALRRKIIARGQRLDEILASVPADDNSLNYVKWLTENSSGLKV